MGEACPKPGNSVFHTTLLVALQYTGTPFSWLVPSSRDPRQQGQFSAEALGAVLNARGRNPSEIRRPKPEARRKVKIRNPKAARTRGGRRVDLTDLRDRSEKRRVGK